MDDSNNDNDISLMVEESMAKQIVSVPRSVFPEWLLVWNWSLNYCYTVFYGYLMACHWLIWLTNLFDILLTCRFYVAQIMSGLNLDMFWLMIAL